MNYNGRELQGDGVDQVFRCLAAITSALRAMLPSTPSPIRRNNKKQQKEEGGAGHAVVSLSTLMELLTKKVDLNSVLGQIVAEVARPFLRFTGEIYVTEAIRRMQDIERAVRATYAALISQQPLLDASLCPEKESENTSVLPAPFAPAPTPMHPAVERSAQRPQFFASPLSQSFIPQLTQPQPTPAARSRRMPDYSTLSYQNQLGEKTSWDQMVQLLQKSPQEPQQPQRQDLARVTLGILQQLKQNVEALGLPEVYQQSLIDVEQHLNREVQPAQIQEKEDHFDGDLNDTGMEFQHINGFELRMQHIPGPDSFLAAGMTDSEQPYPGLDDYAFLSDFSPFTPQPAPSTTTTTTTTSTSTPSLTEPQGFGTEEEEEEEWKEKEKSESSESRPESPSAVDTYQDWWMN